jgi:hypothetical protein
MEVGSTFFGDVIRARQNRHRLFIKKAQIAIATCEQLGIILSEKHDLFELGNELLGRIERDQF